MTDARTGEGRSYGVVPPGYRLPADVHLGVVRLQVADLDRSLEWYGRVLGPQVLHRDADHVSLAAAGSRTPLIELQRHPGARPVPRRGRLGLYHYAILLPDRPALGQFVRHLAGIGERAGMSDHLLSEATYLSDPDGLGIEVYADRPRDTWGVAGGQLVMATDPLDVPGLLREAPSAPWLGLPEGTRMGHIHLYVDDLARAEQFYHAGLGFDKIVWSYPGALFMSAGGYHHHLGTNTWAAGAVPAGPDDARLLEWELILPSAEQVDAALSSLRGVGITPILNEAPGLVRDPWGTALRLRS